MPVLVGTSGWQYADWLEGFYTGVPQRRWFEHLLTHYRTVELNVSFNRLPKREVFAGWRDRSPADAVITVKASRYLTHVKRLRDPGPSVELLMSRAAALHDKLGPVLVQLPPDLTADIDGSTHPLDAFPPGVRLAVEPRHASVDRRRTVTCGCTRVAPARGRGTAPRRLLGGPLASPRPTPMRTTASLISTTTRTAPPVPTRWSSPRRCALGRSVSRVPPAG